MPFEICIWGSPIMQFGGIWYFSTSRLQIGRPKDGWRGLWLSPCYTVHNIISISIMDSLSVYMYNTEMVARACSECCESSKPSKHTRLPNTGLMLATVYDAGPTSAQHWVEVSCLLGVHRPRAANVSAASHESFPACQPLISCIFWFGLKYRGCLRLWFRNA